MADIELHESQAFQRSLSVLQGIHEEQYIGGEDSLYIPIYEPVHTDSNNNSPPYYGDYCEDHHLNHLRNINFMLSGSNYQQPVYRGSDIDDSHDSDDSSVMLSEIDQIELEMIECYEEEREHHFIKTEPQYYSCDHYHQPSYRPSQPSQNNLPAFETLFNKTRNGSHVNRLYPSHMTDSEDDEESNSICRKGKRGAKNVLLWKFLLEELKKGKNVEWTDISQGTFRFVDTSEISRLWGQKKRKDDMNFEKLSRGIRHYYKSGFMSRQEGTRLIYKFNWAKVPKRYRQFDVKRGIPIKEHAF